MERVVADEELFVADHHVGGDVLAGPGGGSGDAKAGLPGGLEKAGDGTGQ
jgi:hypothetical protein